MTTVLSSISRRPTCPRWACAAAGARESPRSHGPSHRLRSLSPSPRVSRASSASRNSRPVRRAAGRISAMTSTEFTTTDMTRYPQVTVVVGGCGHVGLPWRSGSPRAGSPRHLRPEPDHRRPGRRWKAPLAHVRLGHDHFAHEAEHTPDLDQSRGDDVVKDVLEEVADEEAILRPAEMLSMDSQCPAVRSSTTASRGTHFCS